MDNKGECFRLKKAVININHFIEELTHKLELKTAFTIPIFGGIDIPESTFFSWIIVAVVGVLCFAATRKLSVRPSNFQLYIEALVEFTTKMFENSLGHGAKQYVDYILVVATYLVFSNVFVGLLGQSPPTRDLNVTAALAIMSIILIQYASIKAKGSKGYLKSFGEPVKIIAPLNVLEILIKPLSLCMRLFGNIFGAYLIMEIIRIVLPVGVPAVFSIYFELFDGTLQAYLFVFLTSLYLKEATE